MMICRADFEDLFPHLFAPKARPVAKKVQIQKVACIARWKDDGGTVQTLPPPPSHLQGTNRMHVS